MRTRTLLTAAVLTLSFAQTGAIAMLAHASGAGVAVAAAPYCRRSLATSSTPTANQSASRRPAVFVHGWTGNGNVRTGKPSLQALADVLTRQVDNQIQAYFYDYGPVSTTWASRPEVAGCLGEYVTAVSKAFRHAGGDGKVLIVAHSMGGLATLYAADGRYTTAPIASLLAGVVTFDTPYLGSPWGGTPLAGLLEQGKAAGVPPPSSDAGRCLGLRGQHGALPANCGDEPPLLPAGVPLQQIAGSIAVHRSLFGFSAYDLPLASDAVVSVDSAHSYVDAAATGVSAKGQKTRLDTDGCVVDYSAVQGRIMSKVFSPTPSGLISAGLLELAQLKIDSTAMDAAVSGHLTPGAIVYDAAAVLTAPCSHVNVVHDQSAINLATEGLKADLAADPVTRPVAAPCTTTCTEWSWGNNTEGRLGDGTNNSSAVPVQVSGLTGVTAISGSYALRSDGTVWAWGSNTQGQLGNGTTGNSSAVPVKVSGLTGVTAIAGALDGGVGAYALRSDGTVWAWGDNHSGALGNGTTTQSTVPVKVSGLTGVTAIADGDGTGYALRSDGTVWEWGIYFDTPDDPTILHRRLVPVKVSGLTGVTAIAGSYALLSNGTVWAWGGNRDWADNLYGSLGDGTTSNGSTVPVRVSGLTGVTAIAAGLGSGYALRSDGTVWAWGPNFFGELGNGTTTQSTVPVKVSGLIGVTAIAGGHVGAYALRSDGTVWAWGDNHYGALGNGTTTQSTVPVKVSGLTGVAAIAGGDGTGHALVGP
jgi:alpha-tubulin suppressor-like RCC1 family protein/pimeloyl-ACP methyl ester carboxylesterase